jgi:hypothetical protein
MNGALQALSAWVFNTLVKQKFLDGKRSYIGGASTILGGLIIVLDMVVNGEYSNEKAGAAYAAFALGYTILGHAGKQEKMLEAVQEMTDARR